MGRYSYAQGSCPGWEHSWERMHFPSVPCASQLGQTLDWESLVHCWKVHGLAKGRGLFQLWRSHSLRCPWDSDGFNALSKVIFRGPAPGAFPITCIHSSSYMQFLSLQPHETLPGQKRFLPPTALFTCGHALKLCMRQSCKVVPSVRVNDLSARSPLTSGISSYFVWWFLHIE